MVRQKSKLANIDYYTHYNVIILMHNVTSEICVFESDLGLVYVIIPNITLHYITLITLHYTLTYSFILGCNYLVFSV